MRSIVIIIALATLASLPAQSPATYHVSHTYTLGGEGGWDYPKRRLKSERLPRLRIVASGLPNSKLRIHAHRDL
jgi:hypothetical protein